jgi:type II secretory pathway component PulK
MMRRAAAAVCLPTSSRCRSVRRGTAIIVAIVALVLVTAICFSLVRITLSTVEQADRQQWRRQALWLAESALAQAAVRLRNNGELADDTWEITLPDSHGAREGRIELEVTASADDPQARIVTATAEFPRHPTDRVRITRTLTVTQSTPQPDES